jgi:hypothetical protein
MRPTFASWARPCPCHLRHFHVVPKPEAHRTRRLLPVPTTCSIPQVRAPPRRSASTSSGPSRRAITVTSDDGRYDWKDLSTGEKAARGTQQTFNFALVSLGLVGTVRPSAPFSGFL